MADRLAPFLGERAPGLARRLIEQFGGLHAALAAPPPSAVDPELAEVCRLLRSARELLEEAVREPLQGLPVLASDRALLDYLRLAIGGERRESFLAVYLDPRGHYLSDEIVARGSSRRLRLSARGLFHRALNLGAHSLLLAHNHPSGRCFPSSHDQVTTDHLRMAASWLDIALVDHLIVTPAKVFSMRTGRLL